MRRGFTIVELLIVISIIGILTTIGFLGFGKYQADARDSERSNKATIISEYLENYYSENGEYPNCSSLVSNTSTVLSGIDAAVLTTPQKLAGETNSIKCTDLTSPSQGDYFSYVGDGSGACAIGGSCLQYTIKYKNESGNTIDTLQSRHFTDIKTAGDIGSLSASATGFTSINTTWQSIDNATSYTLQRATDINFSNNLVSGTVSGLSSSITGLSYNTKYYFRVQPVASNSIGNWSNTTNTTTWSLAAPASPLSHSQAGFTSINTGWPAVTYATGYEIQRATDSGFTVGVATQTNSTTSHTVTGLAYGTQYYIRIRATASGYSGAWSNTIIESTWTLAAPVGTATANSTTQITESWGAISNAASYSVQGDDNAGFTSPTPYSGVTALSKAHTSLTPGKTYYFRVQAINGSYASSWSTTHTATTTISAPTCTATTNSTTQITVACGAISGATAYNYQADDNTSFTSPAQYSSASASYAVTALTPGKTWYFRVQTVGANTSSGWSGTSNATTTISAPTCTATTNSTTQITVACGAISGATAYNYQVDDNSLFSSSAQYSSASASYAITGMTPGKTWYFRVQTVGANTYSGWSGTSNATTTISAPSVSATANSMTQITASWGAISGASSYSVYYANNSSFTGQVGYNTTSTSYVFTGLSPGTPYWFRVYTLGANTNSGWSSAATATTTSPSLSGLQQACKGSYSGTYTKLYYQLWLDVREVSYNIAANTSNVSWSLYRIKTATFAGTVGSYDLTAWGWNTNIGGNIYSGSSASSAFRYAAPLYTTELIYSTTTTIGHDSNGNANMYYGAHDGGRATFGQADCANYYNLSDLK